MKILKQDEPAYQRVNDEYGCNSYWCQTLWCSDGTCVIGQGMTCEEAERNASEKRVKHEQFLQLSAKEKIREIFSKYDDNQYPCAVDTGHLLKAMAKLLGAL